MVIAIDGPAGVGKSEITKMLAEELGIYYLNSGNFYRAAAYRMLKHNLDTSLHDARVRSTSDALFEIKNHRFFLDGVDVEDDLHTREIDMVSSAVSSDPAVREIINKRIHKISESLSLICEGRDITTVVFPDADFKFYFDAKPEIRAHRRFLQKPDGLTEAEILEEINKRDYADKNKEVGSLKISKDAVYIDTSDLTISQVYEKVLRLIKKN